MLPIFNQSFLSIETKNVKTMVFSKEVKLDVATFKLSIATADVSIDYPTRTEIL